MPVTVTLKPLVHRGEECIGIFFEINDRLQAALRKTGVVKFSRTHQCWYATLSRENYNKVFFALQRLATIEQSALHQFLAEKKKGLPSLRGVPSATDRGLIVPDRVPPARPSAPKAKNKNISAVNSHILPAMQQYLQLKAYSPSTIRTYLNEMAQLLGTLKNIPADDLTPEHLKRYLVYCYQKLGLKENTLHSRINALKFYYEQVLRREKFFWEIPRPKKENLLPRFFNQDEIATLLRATVNIKHRTMLMMAYSSGLRVSEVVNLKTADIDSKRMCILIRQAKGKKDRIVALSPVMLVMLREYAMQYQPDKAGWLFEGASKGDPYSTRSLQEVLQASKAKAGIIKPGSIHALRHSFATHLVDRGTDVTMIQKLLGHNDIKTTLRYLHTTNKDLLKIISPLDDLDLT